jgi:transcriptional regulator with XRE-family HTH domain
MGYIQKPYAELGKRLKVLREKTKRSLSEVSGAVEIEEALLKQIEEGNKRPGEDLMLLLISYFNMPDQEALSLWGLAKYDSELTDHVDLDLNGPQDNEDIAQLASKSMVMLFSMDVRTMYTDGVDIGWNEAGITATFTQSNSQLNGEPHKTIPVAKVGMSHEQAEKVIATLQTALLHAKYANRNKLLPPNTDTKK